MSVEAITWALKQRVGRSSTKHVLMLLANVTTAPLNRIYTSIAYLAEATEMDRKTIIAAIEKLQALGFISDTGDRIGKTGQIPVYQLNMIEPAGADDKEKRNRSENGTVPDLDSNSTKNGGKQYQKRSQTVPKTVHGTQGTKGKRKGTQTRGKRANVCVELPDWLPQIAWDSWLDHRKAMKAPFTQRAAELSISTLARLRGEGNDPVSVIDESVLRGWTGLFPLRQAGGGGPIQGGAVSSGTWWESWEGIVAMGATLGRPYDERMNRVQYKRWVFKAAGPGAWQEAELAAAARMNEFEYERVFAYFMGEKPVSPQQLAQRAAEQRGATS